MYFFFKDIIFPLANLHKKVHGTLSMKVGTSRPTKKQTKFEKTTF
jgi:hypothetical protein